MKFGLYVAGAFSAVAFLYGIYHAGYKSADTHWKLEWAQRDKADLVAKGKRENEERSEEQRRQKAADDERDRAAQELASAKADAADAAAVGERLQLDLANLRKQLAGSETGRLSATVAASAAKAQIGILLAQLLSESDKAAGEYAAEADRNYAAGQSCERSYDQVTNTKINAGEKQ